MMIVIPMLIQTVTFGWIFDHLLDGDAGNAIMFAGALLAVAALVMTQIKEPPIVRDIDELGEMPTLQAA
jgi:maltose/moltooligosaccharide transporter